MFLLKLSKKIIIPVMMIILVSSNVSIVHAQVEEGEKDAGFFDEIIALTNENRTKYGINELEKNELLMRAAQQKAENMAELGYFAHTSPTGITPWQWFYGTGYKPLKAGENLALAYSENILIVNSWMNSPSHKKNLLNPAFQEIGIGVAKGMYKGKEMVFVVQFFGTQK